MVYDGTLLESVEALAEPSGVTVGGEIWQRLHEEETELSKSRLNENRLREISDAQDRVIEGVYGQCTDCGEEIDSSRLAADPAAARCLSCQSMVDDQVCHSSS